VEDVDKLRDDLESTKQLLELEVRSKALLEKDNKRMQSELEKMRNELAK
jgi:chaperonin cofactor prefoldin